MYSARIIRQAGQAAPALYLKEFFMFSGIYVREYVVGDKQQETDTEEVDLNVVFSESVNEKERPNAFCEYTMDMSSINLTTKKGKACLKKNLNNMVEHLSSYFGEEFKNPLKKLVSIFTEHDYAHFDYERHFFFKQMTSEEKLEICQKYYDCYSELDQYDQKSSLQGKRNIYVKFAMLNCARKVNDTCSERGEIPLFETRLLMREAADILKLDKGFSMAHVLAGMLGLSDDTLWSEGEHYLTKAIEAEGEKKHSTFIYYCLGHFIEIQRKNFDEAWPYYSKILQISPKNCRALFKKGCMLLREEDWEKTCGQFSEVRDMMKEKETSELLPLNIEYWYKCDRILSESSLIGRYREVEEEVLQEEARACAEDKWKDCESMRCFLGKAKVENYHNYFRNKLERHNLHEMTRL